MLTKNMTKQLYVLFLCTFLTVQTISPMPPQDLIIEPFLSNYMIYFACACAGAALCALINICFLNESAPIPITKNDVAKPINPEKEAFQKRMEEQLDKLAEEAKQLRRNAQEQEAKIENMGTFSKGLLMISISLAQQNVLCSQSLRQTQFITEMYNSLNKKNISLPISVAVYWHKKYTDAQKKLNAQESALQKKRFALDNTPQQ